MAMANNNRKRSHPCTSFNKDDDDASSSSSSVGWDPDGDGSHGNISNDEIRNNGRDHSQSASFPSQIDVAFATATTSGGAIGGGADMMVDNGSPDNNRDESMDSHSNSSSSSDDDEMSRELSHPITPPERIRYQMLGAPTLLYRHAPSYRSPANRPSTLTPQQLFMALYTKNHPIQSWFNNTALKQPKQTRSAFLTSTHIPCPARPWGTTTTTTTGGEEGPTKQRKCYAFNVYRSEMTKMRKDAGLPRFTMNEVAARWKEMSEEEKCIYHQMADEQNETVVNKDASAKDVGLEEQGNDKVRWSRRNPSKEGLPKQRKISAYDVYASEMFTMCKEAGFPPCTLKEIAALWKEMTEEVKARYQQMADERNSIKSSCARNVPEKEHIAPEQLRGGGLRDEAPVISSDTGEMEMMEQSLMIESIANTPQLPPFNVEDVNGVDTSLEPSIPDNPMSQDVPKEVGGPSGYGNCLLTIPCKCQTCNLRPPSWFLVHPTGDNLSSVSMGKLSLPRGSSRHVDHAAADIDVGGRILQISQCGPRLKSTDGILCLVARTSQHCSVIYAHSNCMTSASTKVCSTRYVLNEKARINMLRLLQLPHHPVLIACDPKTTISYFTCPTFAILSRDDPGKCTTIHRVVVRDEPIVKVHSISSTLSDISFIEFCSDDRMSLWVAARSIAIPKLSHSCKSTLLFAAGGRFWFAQQLRFAHTNLIHQHF